MLLTGVVSPLAALTAIGSEWNLFLFFFGLMLTAAVATWPAFSIGQQASRRGSRR